jgi:hypothetical protein
MRLNSYLAALALLIAPVAVCAQDAAAPSDQAPPQASGPAPAPAQPPPPTVVPPPAAAPAPSAPSGPLAAGTVLMRFKYVQGEVLRYHMTMNMAMSIPMNGQSMPMNTTADMTTTQTVQSVDAQGNATLIATIDNPNMNMTMNGQPFPLPASATDSLKTGYTEVISPLGGILSMKANAPAAQAGGSAGMAAPGMPSVTGMFGQGQLSGLTALPDHPVKVGDIWRTTGSLAALGTQMYVKMALVGLDSSSGSTLATIATKIYADFKPSTASTVQMNGQMTGSGHNIFDVDHGELTEMATNMDMDMSVPSPSGTLPMKLNMTMKMDLISSR